MAVNDSEVANGMLRIQIGEQVFTVEPGDTFTFGRSGVSGILGEGDSTVSRTHGVISNYADRWEITSTGSYFGFLIHDVESAATLEVPVGIGPIGVPFNSVIIVVPARQRYVLSVEAPHRPTIQPALRPDMPVSTAATEQVIPEESCFDSKGRALRWFQVLVALCEPRLLLERGPVTIPSDAAIRHRLGMGSSSFDRAFARARSELGFEPYTPLVRLAMMNVAIHQGVVRPEHLALLPDPDELQ